MRITTYAQLMELLDGLYAGGADRTSKEAAPFWDELLSGFEVAIGRSVADNVIQEYGPPARLPASVRLDR